MIQKIVTYLILLCAAGFIAWKFLQKRKKNAAQEAACADCPLANACKKQEKQKKI